MASHFYPPLCLYCENNDVVLSELFCKECQERYEYLRRQVIVYNEIKNPWSIWHNCTTELHEEQVASYMAELNEMTDRAGLNLEKHNRLRDAVNERRRKLRKASRKKGGRPADPVNDWAWEEFVKGRALHDITPQWIAFRKLTMKSSDPIELSKMIKRRLRDEGE